MEEGRPRLLYVYDPHRASGDSWRDDPASGWAARRGRHRSRRGGGGAARGGTKPRIQTQRNDRQLQNPEAHNPDGRGTSYTYVYLDIVLLGFERWIPCPTRARSSA